MQDLQKKKKKQELRLEKTAEFHLFKRTHKVFLRFGAIGIGEQACRRDESAGLPVWAWFDSGPVP